MPPVTTVDPGLWAAIWNALPPEWQHIAILVFGLSYLTGHFISLTDTPAPNTPWGRVYCLLEKFAGIYGKAKKEGVPVPTPDQMLADLRAGAAKLVADAQAAGKPVDVAELAKLLSAPTHAAPAAPSTP